LLVTGLWLFAAGLWLLVTGLWLFAAGTWRLNGYCLIGSIKKPIQPMRQIKLIQRIVFHSAIRNPKSPIRNHSLFAAQICIFYFGAVHHI
jgi:hypothetical protein